MFPVLLLVLFHHVADECFQHFCGVFYLPFLLVGHGDLDGLADTLFVNYAGDTDAGSFQALAVLFSQYVGYRKYGVLVLQDRLYDTEGGHGDSVEGGALQGNDVRAAGLGFIGNLLLDFLFFLLFCRQEVIDGLACYVDAAPDGFFSLCTFAQNN